MLSMHCLVSAALLIPYVAAGITACATTSAAPASPTPPASDPFWSQPSNFGSLSPGQVFNCRYVNWNPVNGSSASIQYAYKSRLRNGTDIVAVATLLIPSNNPSGPYSQLLSYQIPYDSPTSFCGPSFAFATGSGGDTTNTYTIGNDAGSDPAPLKALAAKIPVVIADYETLSASFINGVSEGLGVLNGIEAVIGYSGLFTSNPNVALWGYSGGALATEFALELATFYAPTYPYTIIGASLGGLTPIARNVANLVNGNGIYAALIPYGFLGLSYEVPAVASFLQRNLSNAIQFGKSSSYRTRFYYAASNHCNYETGPDFLNTDFNAWFALPSGYNITTIPEISNALNTYGVMGQLATPKVPMYFYKGTADEVSNIADTDALYQQYCSNNGQIQYVRIQGDTHGQAQNDGLNNAWLYLLWLFNGGGASPGCSSQTVNPPSS